MVKRKGKNYLVLFLASFFVFTFCIIFNPTKTSAGTNWYGNNWNYRKEIIIDHTKVPNVDQPNFPVLISLADSDLQNHARSDGNDILFTDSTGTNKIPYEREQYVNSTGTLVAWVKIAKLSHTIDNKIYIYYGNPAALDQQDSTGGVWDNNFVGVWHSGDASLATIADSTANTNTGTKYGSTGPIPVIGKIGNAQSYDGIDSYVGLVPSGTLSAPFTISTWAKVLDDQNTHTVIGARNPNDESFDFKFDTGDNIHGDIGDGNDWMTTAADVDTGVFSYSADTWYQITYVVKTDGYSIYVNGNDVADGVYDNPGTPLLFDADHNLYIGQVGYSDEWFSGAIDEVRLSNATRSPDWIKTEYNNENSPSEFYSLGDEESAPSSLKDITAFSFEQGLGVITGTNIAVVVPYETDVTALVPTISITGSTISPSSGVAEDFTNPQTYTVTAADSTTQSYTITVTIAPSLDATLRGLTVNGDALISFTPSVFLYDDVLPAGTTVIPVVAATTNNVGANSLITQAENLPGSAIVLVNAADGLTRQTYKINFSVASAAVFTAPPTSAPVTNVGGGNALLRYGATTGMVTALPATELLITPISSGGNIAQSASVSVKAIVEAKPVTEESEKLSKNQTASSIAFPVSVLTSKEKPIKPATLTAGVSDVLQPAELLVAVKNIMAFGTGKTWLFVIVLLLAVIAVTYVVIYFVKKR